MINGLIAIWSGAIADIPAGWHLCDGNDGTPDLRDRFVYGAGGIKNPGDTGGSATHTHTFTGDGHNHTLDEGNDIAAGAVYSATTSIDPAAGTTDTGDSMKPFYALAYIMKL